MSEFKCHKFIFKRYEAISGFLAFNNKRESIGFDEVCKEIDELSKLKEENKLLKSLLEEIMPIAQKYYLRSSFFTTVNKVFGWE